MTHSEKKTLEIADRQYKEGIINRREYLHLYEFYPNANPIEDKDT
jgi:hypothetical protein